MQIDPEEPEPRKLRSLLAEALAIGGALVLAIVLFLVLVGD